MGDANPDWTEVSEDNVKMAILAAYDPNPTQTSETILEEAIRITSRDRQDTYGHPREDFGKITGQINALFGEEIKQRVLEGKDPISLEMWPLFMICVKLARLQKTPQHRDSKVDVAGYINTYDMLGD